MGHRRVEARADGALVVEMRDFSLVDRRFLHEILSSRLAQLRAGAHGDDRGDVTTSTIHAKVPSQALKIGFLTDERRPGPSVANDLQAQVEIDRAETVNVEHSFGQLEEGINIGLVLRSCQDVVNIDEHEHHKTSLGVKLSEETSFRGQLHVTPSLKVAV